MHPAIARFLSVLSVSAALLATGCANVEKINYDKAAGSRVKKIALLPVREPATPVVMNIGNGSVMFGLVGGLVQAGIDQSNGSRFKEALDAGGTTFADRIVESATRELKGRGFEVVYLSNQSLKVGADGKTADYSGIETDADAILNIWVAMNGYVSPAFSTNYQPWVTMGARLVDAKTRQPLYYRMFRSGFGSSNEKIEDVGFDEKYQYGSADALVAAAAQAGEGLRESHRRVVRRISEHLQ